MAQPAAPAPSVKRALLCRPSHFTVDYVINPQMQPHSVDQPRALKQWETLVKTLHTIGIKTEIIEQEPDVPDMVFANDQGIVRDGAVLLANFRYAQRAQERVYYREWFRTHGFRLRALTNLFPFEGSDVCFVAGMLVVGTGFRADVTVCDELAQKLGVEVMPLRIVDPFFYHLDMGFLPIDDQTAFYFPGAFSKNSQSLLKRLVPNLLPLSAAAAKAYCTNSFVSGKDIVIPTGAPEAFRKDLAGLGLRTHAVDISEFYKAGGGIRCLINILE